MRFGAGNPTASEAKHEEVSIASRARDELALSQQELGEDCTHESASLAARFAFTNAREALESEPLGVETGAAATDDAKAAQSVRARQVREDPSMVDGGRESSV